MMAKCVPITSGRLSLVVNDHAEQTLYPQKQAELQNMFQQQREADTFIRRARRGKIALSKARKVKAADDFEEKLARRIHEEAGSSARL